MKPTSAHVCPPPDPAHGSDGGHAWLTSSGTARPRGSIGRRNSPWARAPIMACTYAMATLLAVRRHAPLVHMVNDVVVRRGLLSLPRRLTLQPIYQLPLNFTKFNGAAAKVAKRKALIAPRRQSRVADRWRRSRAFVWHPGRLHRGATAVATAKKVPRHAC